MKTAIRYGLLIAFGMIAWTLIEYALGFHTTRAEVGSRTGFLSVLIPVAGIYFGIKSARDDEPGGRISFLKALKVGVVVSLVAATLTTVFIPLYHRHINPRAADHVASYTRSNMQAEGASAEQIASAEQSIRDQLRPGNQALAMFFSALLGGALISAVAALVLSRRKTPPGAAFAKGGRVNS